MVRRTLISLVILTAAHVLPGTSAGAADPTRYGSGVTIKDATPLSEVLTAPSTFEGKTLRVEGYVTAVCQEMGCWLALAPSTAKGDPTLMIQVEHGVVSFPVSAKGKFAAAEGIVQRVGSPESREAAEELARVQGKAAADVGQWQIKATGALIY